MFFTVVLYTGCLSSDPIKKDEFNGNWHMRVMDGMDVRKARAILDFDMDKMKLSGFDGCNRISGTLVENSDTNITVPLLRSTRMACRNKMHSWVSKRLKETLNESFSIAKEKKYGIQGITVKSLSHELFFKKMQR